MGLTIKFDTGNAAFRDITEPGRILREIADELDEVPARGIEYSGRIRDINGNPVGDWHYTRPGETHIVELSVTLEMDEMDGTPEESAEKALELVEEAIQQDVDTSAKVKVISYAEEEE